MTKYKVDRINSRDILWPECIEKILDDHAHNGWEVVSVCRTGFVDGQSYYLITLRRIVQPDQEGNTHDDST